MRADDSPADSNWPHRSRGTFRNEATKGLDASTTKRPDADPMPGPVTGKNVNERHCGTIVLDVNVDERLGKGVENLVQGGNGFATDLGLFYLVPRHGGDDTADSVTRSSIGSWNATSTPSLVA